MTCLTTQSNLVIYVYVSFAAEKENIEFFRKICSLQINTYGQRIALMNFYECSRSRSFLELGKRSFTFLNKKIVFSEIARPIKTNFYVLRVNESIYGVCPRNT